MSDSARVRARAIAQERWDECDCVDEDYRPCAVCMLSGVDKALDDAARPLGSVTEEWLYERTEKAEAEAAALRERVAGLEGALRNLIEQNVYRRDSGHAKECICTFCLIMAEAEAALNRAI